MKIERRNNNSTVKEKPSEKPSEKEGFDNDFNKLFKAKKEGNFAIKAVIFLAGVSITAAFILSYLVSNAAYSKIAVIDTGGRYLQTSIEEKENLEKALILQTCSNLSYYINSFNMNGYLENYDRARSYCNTGELNKIVDVYQADKLYYDAIERGVVFTCELNKIHEIKALESGDVEASFNSIMTRKDGAFTEKYLIESYGVPSKTTPQFPDNTTGWTFVNYTQSMNLYE